MTKQDLANGLLNKYVGAIAAGGIGVAAGNAMAGPSLDDLNAGKPSHQHYMTQIGHAQNNAARGWTDLSDQDYAVVEGVRQGLMGDRITNQELDQMIMNQDISARQAYLLGDVHNFGSSSETFNDPKYEAALAYLRSGANG